MAARYGRAEALVDTLLANFAEVQHALEYKVLRAEAALDAALDGVAARDRALAARVATLEAELSAGAQSTLARRLGALERLEREAAKTAHATTLVDGAEGPKRGILTTPHEKVLESKIAQGTKRIVRRATTDHRRSVSGSFALLVVLLLQAAGAFALYTVYAKFKRAKLL